MEQTKTVPELLEALGKTADEVADTLRKGGFKGLCGKGMTDCPVANYLKANGVPSPEVREGKFANVLVGVTQYDPPEPVREFVKKFDDMEYKDLILEEMP